MKILYAVTTILLFIVLITSCSTPDNEDKPANTEDEVTPSETNMPEPTSEPEPTPEIDAQATIESNAAAAQRQMEDAGIYTEKYRPQFHFSPMRGWIGDPDGMLRYQDTYHVWWWGHAESKDLVHWENQIPSAMAGDDGSFIYFSGSVVVDENNSSGFGDGTKPPMIALYTMFFNDVKPEVQGLSVSHDYANFVFYKGNPVLEAEPKFFRDPMVFWHDETGRWIMAIALPEKHQVSFYASDNLKEWEHLSDFGPAGALNGWWEVPDLYQLPVDGDPNNTRWVLQIGRGPNRVQYFIGDFDGTQFTLNPEENGTTTNWLDYGPDYYAVRTFRDYDHVEDRIVTFGWMGNWQYANNVPTSWGKGALSLPRELELRTYEGELQIVQRPIPALEQLRGDEVTLENVELTDTRPLSEFTPALNSYELDLTIRITDPDTRFGIRLAESDEHAFTLGYDTSTSALFLDRMKGERAFLGDEFPKQLTAPLQPQADGTIRLHIFVNQSSVELFANEGEVTMTALMFPEPDSTGITLFVEGGTAVLERLTAWELTSIWQGILE